MQFGVTAALVGHYVRHEGGTPPAPDVQGAWYTLEHVFTIVPGSDALPKPPITGKTDVPRAPLVVLERG